MCASHAQRYARWCTHGQTKLSASLSTLHNTCDVYEMEGHVKLSLQLPREPEAMAAAEAAREAAAQAAVQAEQAVDVEAVRSLRMKLRQILNNFLGHKRYSSLFAVPPRVDDDPEFWRRVITFSHLLIRCDCKQDFVLDWLGQTHGLSPVLSKTYQDASACVGGVVEFI